VIGVAVMLASCGESTQDQTASGSPTALQAEIVASELLPGEQRLPLGILDHNTPVNDATVHVRAFVLVSSTSMQFKGESDAPFRGKDLEGKGLYVAHLTFDVAGNWLAEITASRPSGQHGVMRLPFNVIANAIVPAPGQPAPRSHNPTLKDVPDISYIDSGLPPDDMHQLSVADAIAQHRPTLVIFGSPALCVSQICGPEVHVVQSLEPQYRDRLTFIHIEPYQLKPQPDRSRLSPTLLEWRLQSEPWIFLIDSKGSIRSRFEGPTGSDEVQAAVEQLLTGS
jgi:hypothetical protein